LGDTLIGRRKWIDPEVLRERDILLDPDDIRVNKYVEEVRDRMVEAYISYFVVMVELERRHFGKNSYFSMMDG